MLFMNGLNGLKLGKKAIYNLAVKTSDNAAYGIRGREPGGRANQGTYFSVKGEK